MKDEGPIYNLPTYHHLPWNADATRQAHSLRHELQTKLNAGFDALEARGAVVHHSTWGPGGVHRGWHDLLTRAVLFAVCQGQDRVTWKNVQDAYIVLLEAVGRVKQ